MIGIPLGFLALGALAVNVRSGEGREPLHSDALAVTLTVAIILWLIASCVVSQRRLSLKEGFAATSLVFLTADLALLVASPYNYNLLSGYPVRTMLFTCAVVAAVGVVASLAVGLDTAIFEFVSGITAMLVTFADAMEIVTSTKWTEQDRMVTASAMVLVSIPAGAVFRFGPRGAFSRSKAAGA
jgi:hypothetical protein